MLKKTITYDNFNGERVTEHFFFHLSKAELVELEMSYDGGLSEMLTKIVAAEDSKSIIAEFKKIVLGAYGQKSPDGRRFIKNQQLRDEFESTEAYSELFMELITNTDAAIEFINGVIPKNLAEEATKVVDTGSRVIAVVPDMSKEPIPEPIPDPIILSKKDVETMSPLEFAQLGARLASGEVKLAE